MLFWVTAKNVGDVLLRHTVFCSCMNIIFNSLLAQLVKYDVHTTRNIKFYRPFYHVLLLYRSRLLWHLWMYTNIQNACVVAHQFIDGWWQPARFPSSQHWHTNDDVNVNFRRKYSSISWSAADDRCIWSVLDRGCERKQLDICQRNRLRSFRWRQKRQRQLNVREQCCSRLAVRRNTARQGHRPCRRCRHSPSVNVYLRTENLHALRYQEGGALTFIFGTSTQFGVKKNDEWPATYFFPSTSLFQNV